MMARLPTSPARATTDASKGTPESSRRRVRSRRRGWEPSTRRRRRGRDRRHWSLGTTTGVVEALWRNLSEIYPALEYKGDSRTGLDRAGGGTGEGGSERPGVLRRAAGTMARLRDTHTRIVPIAGQPALETPLVVLNEVEGKVP